MMKEKYLKMSPRMRILLILKRLLRSIRKLRANQKRNKSSSDPKRVRLINGEGAKR